MIPLRRLALLIVCLVVLSGCAAAALALSGAGVVLGSVGVFQTYKARVAQEDETSEIKALRESIERHQAEVRRLNEELLRRKP